MKTLLICRFLFCILLKCSLPIISGSRLEGNVCKICSCSTNDGFKVVNCSSSSSLPSAHIPEGTTYLDLSNNHISTLTDEDIDRFKQVKVLDLRGNPLVCDCRLALSIKRLTSSNDVRVIGYCYAPESSVAMEIDQVNPRTICRNSFKPVVKHRTRRSAAVINCTIGSPNCAYFLCYNVHYWLPLTTDWGCCYGNIHDLTSSYCISGSKYGIRKCSHDDFRCTNQHCIPKVWTCNGANDCQDGSDELNCGKCTDHALSFQCQNTRCVNKHRVCDTYNDCGDGSDETYCRKSYLIGWCGVNGFRCANEKCVLKGKVCDGRDDCGDSSDEHGCIKDSSTRCQSGWSFYNNKCFKRYKLDLSWSDALQTCTSINASLIKITSLAEQSFLHSLVRSTLNATITYWIGLRNYTNELRWSDGTSLAGYIAFDQANLATYTGQCVVLENVGMKWRLHNCSAKNPFLCSKGATCRLPCQNGGSCGSSGCLCTSGWTGDDCSYKPPVINMPLYQTIRVRLNSNLSLSCQSTGIPRPHIDWLINKRRQQTVWKAPYVTNITIKVKNTIVLQCSSQNRGGLGLTTVRIVVEDTDVISVKAAIRLTNVRFTDFLKETSSAEYQSLAARIIQAVSSVYFNSPGYRETSIVQFRRGSVICEFIIQFSSQHKDHLTDLLRQTIQTGFIADFKVDKKYLLTEQVIKVCPYDFLNVTWPVTLPASTRVQRCPYDGFGKARRKCSSEGKWERPDYNDCASKNIMVLQTQMTSVLNKTVPSPKQVQEILTNLARESSRPQVKGDIKISTLILAEVVEYNAKLSDDVENSTSNIENFLLIASNLLNLQNNVQMKLLQQSDNTTTLLMSALDDFGLQAAGSLETSQVRSKQFVASNLVMGIAVLTNASNSNVTFPDYNDSRMTSLSEWKAVERSYIVLPKSAFNTSTRVRRVSSFLYRTLSLFLNINSAYDSIGSEFVLGSKVISASVKPTVSLSDPVMTIYNNVKKSNHPPSCVFWDFQLNSHGGGWSRDGCRMTSQDDGKVTCECDHLTNFAVLVSSYQLKEHDLPLRIITFIGCGLSLLGLVVTLLVHVLFWRKLKSNKTIIHVNLCVALLVANVVLLGGLDKTSDKIVCTAIAAILHYFFLSAVAWMLVEGIQIYVAIVMVFEAERKGKYFFLIGWGSPVLIVGIAMAVTQMKGYGTETACWLSAEQGLLYAFIGPVVVVVLINIVIFILVVKAMMTTQRMVTADEKQKARLAAKCCAVLLPLLGLTWSFGVLAIDQNVVIFLYLFAIFNSLQGFFIFVFHCLLDQQVRTAISAWLIRRENTESGLRLRVISSSSNHDTKNIENINKITTNSLTAFPDDIRTSSKVAPKYVRTKYKPSKA